MEYKTYIFDMDGTLLDTLQDLTTSVNYALKQKNMPERTIDEIRQFVGNGVKKLVERAVPAGTSVEDTEDTLNIFKAHYVIHSQDTTAPYPGMQDLLRRLKAKGKNIAVVSNKFYDATVELCKIYFPDTVSVAIGERPGIEKKPAPDTVFEALRQLGVTAEGAVYIGDSEVDLQTARNSGLDCISVLWGFRDKEFLIQNGGTTFVTSPTEIA